MTPFATIGVLSAVLLWEIEHVGSVLLALAIAAIALSVGILVARRLRANLDQLATHYESLLNTADEQSRKAEAANQLKDEFLATLSHELRTPLNSVIGWTRLLATGRLDPNQSARAIQAIERAGWAQSRLVEDLLDMSRIVAGNLQINPRPAVVQRLIETAVDSLRVAADAKHITIDLHLDRRLGPVTVDGDRLQQVVWNLVSNAIKFTPSGGHVDVRLDVSGDDMVLTVSDDGIGFASDVAAHFFERFRQGDSSSTRQYGGLGLGLGIVRHVVELHGGTVMASSAGPNTGSQFIVRLPVRAADAPLADGLQLEPGAPLLRGVSVLVVDDDQNALEFARSTLERSGAVVATASSAREARDRFAREPPDVVVSDLVMPGEDGLQLIREIRELDHKYGRHTPAAALTALARTDDRQQALTAGFEMHVAKPVDPLELVSMVEHLAGVDAPAASAD